MARQPKRLQRRRTKGWQMPEGAVYVGRPTRWGNPYGLNDYRYWFPDTDELGWRRMAVSDFRGLVEGRWAGYPDTPAYPSLKGIQKALSGRDLVCWCSLDAPCHADVLIELANR